MQLFCFWSDRNRNEATLLLCVIPAIVSYTEHIKIYVDNFHLLIYVKYKTYAKANLCKFLSYFFGIVKDNCWPSYLEK